MTRVASGWPTTFWDKTRDKSSVGSVACFFDAFCEFLGFSTAASALIIRDEAFLTLVRRLSSGRVGSFIGPPLIFKNQTLTLVAQTSENISESLVTALIELVARLSGWWA